MVILKSAYGIPDEAVEEYDAQERMINGVIGDSLLYGDDANENRYKAQAYVYDAMKENDTLINTTEREQYMYQTEQSNIGLFVAVTDSLATDNLYEADVINATIIDTNLIESNTKAVNDIVVRLAQSDTMQLTASDSATLDYISLQDPITGGNAVYVARALLHRKIYDPNNGNNLRLASENSSVTLNEIELFPNPAKNFIVIKLKSLSEDIINLIISDVAGRKVFEKEVGIRTSMYKIDLTKFPPGIYSVKINTSKKNQFTKQFVLIR